MKSNVKSILKSMAYTAVFAAGTNQYYIHQERNQVKQHTKYEENIKAIKQNLTADKFDSLKTCIKENNEPIARILSWKDVADSVRNKIDFETIAKSVCKSVK